MHSHYTLIMAVDGETDDHTNIGVLVFREDGGHYGYKLAPLARARRRGDYPRDADGRWIAEYIAGIADVDEFRGRLDTFAACMSCVQFGPLSGALVPPDVLLETMFAKRVKVEAEEGVA